MTVKRKLQESVKAEKPREQRAKKIKVDLDSLPDAVVDGKLVAGVGERVLFERALNGVKKTHVGSVKIVEDSGLVHVWDETREQWFVFSLKEQLPVIKRG